MTATLPPPAPSPITAASATPVPPEPRAVAFAAGAFRIYTLAGQTLGTIVAPGLEYPRHNEVQVAGTSIYYLDGQRHVVVHAEQAGLQDLAYTGSEDLTGFAVSADGSQIAWSTTKWNPSPVSELHVAGIDGSGEHVVAKTDLSLGLEPFYVLQPYRWMPNGDLIYAWQISGIGGYILFFGYSSLYRYRPSDGSTTALVNMSAQVGAPCWNVISDDERYAVGSCRGESGLPGVRERDLEQGTETVFPVVADQGQAGAAAYSPSGSLLGYAVARGNPDDEFGQVLVRLSRNEAPKPIASLSKGFFNEILWADEQRMVVQQNQGDVSNVALLSVDGTLTPIGDGDLIGLMGE